MTDPFTEPARPTPYWLRPRDEATEARHRALVARLEALHREYRQATERRS